MIKEIEVHSVEQTEQLAIKLAVLLTPRMSLRSKETSGRENNVYEGACKRFRHYTDSQ